jgi:tRNA (guanine-N7-)-methyltransferase
MVIPTLWSDDGLPFDWDRVFGRTAPRILDIGCGTGQFVIDSAAARPDRDHLGIELLRPLVQQAARRAKELGLRNVRFAAIDAVAFLGERISVDSIDEIHVYHPQPYVDPAEVHLGMLTAAFFESAWQALRGRGILVLQTDNKKYGKYILDAARRHFDPEVQPGPWPDAPSGRTRREVVARRKGLAILRVIARRRESPLDVAPPAPYFERPGIRKRRIRT